MLEQLGICQPNFEDGLSALIAPGGGWSGESERGRAVNPPWILGFSDWVQRLGAESANIQKKGGGAELS
jgi:hypothetical protein